MWEYSQTIRFELVTPLACGTILADVFDCCRALAQRPSYDGNLGLLLLGTSRNRVQVGPAANSKALAYMLCG